MQPNESNHRTSVESSAAVPPVPNQATLPAQPAFTKPALHGFQAPRTYYCGANPRVSLNQAGDLAAVISDTGLTLLHCGGTGQERLVFFELGGDMLKSSRLGHGGFSADGKHFSLVVSAIPGKLLRADVPALLMDDASKEAVRYPECPAINSRHIFSPSGDFFLSYPASGFPVCILWCIDDSYGSARIRAGGTISLPGFPTAEAVSQSGEMLAIGVGLSESRFLIFLCNLSTGQTNQIEYPYEITRMSFNAAEDALWFGDCRGRLSSLQIDKAALAPIALHLVAECGDTITALTVHGELGRVVLGTSQGAIWQVGSLPSALGKTSEGIIKIGTYLHCPLTSVGASRSGKTLLLGFSSGQVALYGDVSASVY
ncbi:MAG: hypothetical protein EBZ48_00435 [Proteobacteria bacterium]|nr:hypothetical protein [Pseudomonadota bacterium]